MYCTYSLMSVGYIFYRISHVIIERTAGNREIGDLSLRVSKRSRRAENAFSHSGSIDLRARPLRDTRLARICSRSRRLEIYPRLRGVRAILHARRPRPERIQRETHMILRWFPRDLYFREAASGGEHWNDNSTIIIATSIQINQNSSKR